VDLGGLGRGLLILGAVFAVAGAALILSAKGILPRIPGTLTFGRGSVRIFVPIGLSIVLSVVLTVVLNLFLRR